MINLGNDSIKDIKLGTNQVKAVYKGTDKIWPTEEPKPLGSVGDIVYKYLGEDRIRIAHLEDFMLLDENSICPLGMVIIPYGSIFGDDYCDVMSFSFNGFPTSDYKSVYSLGSKFADNPLSQEEIEEFLPHYFAPLDFFRKTYYGHTNISNARNKRDGTLIPMMVINEEDKLYDNVGIDNLNYDTFSKFGVSIAIPLLFEDKELLIPNTQAMSKFPVNNYGGYINLVYADPEPGYSYLLRRDYFNSYDANSFLNKCDYNETIVPGIYTHIATALECCTLNLHEQKIVMYPGYDNGMTLFDYTCWRLTRRTVYLKYVTIPGIDGDILYPTANALNKTGWWFYNPKGILKPISTNNILNINESNSFANRDFGIRVCSLLGHVSA